MRYWLSPKACRGILKRAASRGKELPTLLRTALEWIGRRLPPKAARTSGPIDVATALLAHGGPNGHQDFESETFVVEAPAVAAPLSAGSHASHAPGRHQAVTANHGTSQNRRGTHVTEPGAGGWIVRRLMPVECERLQGWPDDWTRYRADGREIPDGPRYRMIGNGVSATVAYWLAMRARAVLLGDALPSAGTPAELVS